MKMEDEGKKELKSLIAVEQFSARAVKIFAGTIG
jgi:hypothetical protein